MQQMRKDWARVDFNAIKRQAVAFCHCSEDAVTASMLSSLRSFFGCFVIVVGVFFQ